MTNPQLPFKIEIIPENDSVTGRAGLPLVIDTMRAFGMPEIIKKYLNIRQRSGKYTENEMVEDFIMLLCAGGDCVADINILQADLGLCRLLGRGIASADTHFDFLYKFHEEKLIQEAKDARKPGEVAYIPKENEALTSLGKICEEFVREVVKSLKPKVATLDHDATIQEAHKQDALFHYKGGQGYQPSAILWAELNLALADEYRDGNVPAGMSNLQLIKRGFNALPPSVEYLFFRADSACYDESVLKWLANENRTNGPQGYIGFAISADMTVELKRICQKVQENSWQLFEDRGDEKVYWAEVEFTPGDWPKNAEPLRYIVMRIQKKQQTLFADGSDTKYLAIVSNREEEMDGAAIIKWHRQKAGTIELLHDVTKNELGASVPPSGKFGANAAWYRFCLLSFNVLTAMKLHALPEKMRKARPKRLRYLVLNLAGRIIYHAGQLILRMGQQAAEIADYVNARARLAALSCQTNSA